jgi:hypothetical protein
MSTTFLDIALITVLLYNTYTLFRLRYLEQNLLRLQAEAQTHIAVAKAIIEAKVVTLLTPKTLDKTN